MTVRARFVTTWLALAGAHAALTLAFAERAFGFATIYLPIGLALRLGLPLGALAYQPGWFLGHPKPLGWAITLGTWSAVHAGLATLLVRVAPRRHASLAD